MTLIDDVAEIVKMTPIANIDLSFVRGMDPMKAYEGLELKQEYRALIESMVQMYDDSARLGIPKTRAAAISLATLEEIVRYVIGTALKKRLNGVVVLENAAAIVQAQKELTESIAKAKEAMAGLDAEYARKASEATTEQFKAYLKYAADTWGSPTDKRAIGRLIIKVKPGKKHGKA